MDSETRLLLDASGAILPSCLTRSLVGSMSCLLVNYPAPPLLLRSSAMRYYGGQALDHEIDTERQCATCSPMLRRVRSVSELAILRSFQ